VTPTPTPTPSATPTPPGLCEDPVFANPCIPGGAPRITACDVEWALSPVPPFNTAGIPKNSLVCYEGDPRCDSDPDLSNHSCTFQASLCINNSDPRYGTCLASDIASLEVKRPKPTSIDPADVAIVSQLEDQAAGTGPRQFGITVTRLGAVIRSGTPNSTKDLCSAPMAIALPLRHAANGLYYRARKTLRIRSMTSTPRVSSDSIRLQCRPSTCGDGIIQRDHEECDDGNRLNGDGCDQSCHIEH
jgi:cysteine-rich repeat protein